MRSKIKETIHNNEKGIKTMVAMEHVESACSLTLFLVIYLLTSNGIRNFGALATQGCGILINDSLVSPGYPSDYPNNVDCNHLVSIPHGVALEIYFEDFDVEYHSEYMTLLRFLTKKGLYLDATVERFLDVKLQYEIGTEYCGKVFTVYNISILAAPSVSLPSVVETLPGYEVEFSVNGTLPLNTTIMKNSTVLFTGITSTAALIFNEEGNLTLMASNLFGSYYKEFSVIFG
ncbi:hypothetical protein pdam_00007778, partial [Pocillopora damicornis]